MAKLRIGVLISGGGSNLQAIIDACEAERIDGEVVFVGSDRPGVLGLERAEKHHIPTFVVDYSERLLHLKDRIFTFLPEGHDWGDILGKAKVDPLHVEEVMKLVRRTIVESEMLKRMNELKYDLLVLAGFMRLLTPYFIDKINIDPERPRIMNIHPALLPAHPGTDGYGDTWRQGDWVVGGCTVHFVDYCEDTGPIIAQRAVPVRGSSLEDFKRRGLEAEHELYPWCIQRFAQGRLKVVERNMPGKAPKKVVKLLPWPKPDKEDNGDYGV